MTDAAATARPQLPNFDHLDPIELESMRRAIIAKGNGSPEALPIQDLHDLVSICAALRRRTAGPPRTKPAAKRAAKPTSIMDI